MRVLRYVGNLMLLQTNSYIVPKDKRAEHSRLLARFRQVLSKLGCDHFEAYEQVGNNWSGGEASGRFVQIMRFRDRKHQQEVQAAEKTDPAAQALIKEFCDLINLPYQQQQGLFAMGYYTSVLAVAPTRVPGTATIPPAPTDVEEVVATLDLTVSTEDLRTIADQPEEPGSSPANPSLRPT